MIRCREIDDYIAYADSHPEWINKERKLLIENIVKPTLARDDVFFDEKMYRNCLKYCEKHYYPLFPYQKFVYAFVFMFKDDIPLFGKFFVMMGRGNGKDGFIVPLANFFQTPLHGIKNYHVEIVANSEQQVKDTFKVAFDAMDVPEMKGKFRVTRELITNISTRSELKYNTSNASTKDGKRPGCIIFNEIHAYENYEQINVFESALGKVKHPRVFTITTNGYVREAPLDEQLDMMVKILESGENPLGYFPFICRLDKESEVDNKDSWHKANPSMEYMPILAHQIEQDYLEMKALPSKRPEFMTKRMNLPARNEEQTVTSWENILRCSYGDIKHKTPRSTPSISHRLAVVGIDYADVRDFASAGILVKVGEEFIWRQHTWICSESPFLKSIKFPIEQNYGQEEFQDYEIVCNPVIPPEMIVEWVVEQMQIYNVQKITMDTYRYSLFRQIFEKYGIDEETKSNPFGKLRLIRKIASVCGIIAPEVEKLFAEGKINFGASAIMRWYTNNTQVVTDKFGNKQYQKIEPKLRKNDGFMAFLVAMYSKDLLEEVIVYV